MNQLSRKSLIILLIPLLAGCFGGGSTQVQGELQRYPFANFTIDVPGNWRKIAQENFANTIPNETVAMFVNKQEGDDFIQNVNVTKESINSDASSLEYAKANIILGSKAIIDYRPINTQETTIHETKTVLHIFRARNSSTDPIRYFSQAYFARDRVAYTVTCIAKEDDPDQQNTCTEILSSFRFL